MPSRRHSRHHSLSGCDYRQNHGRPGVVYILENPGLRLGWWKIGCSTRSGLHRARDLNNDAATGTPGAFRCVFEAKTLDCGLAEERVFAELLDERRGKRGQEYFEVDIARAQEVIVRNSARIDDEVKPKPMPPAPEPAPQPVPRELPTVFANDPPPEPQADTSPVALVKPSLQAVHPNQDFPPSRLAYANRYCGHCRTLVLPKRKYMFFKYCPHCDNSLP